MESCWAWGSFSGNKYVNHRLALTDRLYISLKGSGLALRGNHRGGPPSGQSDSFLQVSFLVFDFR